VEISEDIGDLIEFMLHTFVRPTDVKVLQHQHVAVVRREQTYLRLTQPETKRHSLPMVSMPQAVEVYERLLARRQAIGPIQPSDHVFFPVWPDREYALVQMRRQFDLVLKRAGLKTSSRGESRTLYCLRHTAIMERLLNGDRIDVLSLARNARTSVEMIERFYARHLHGEMVVGKIHSSV
jgi:integrase